MRVPRLALAGFLVLAAGTAYVMREDITAALNRAPSTTALVLVASPTAAQAVLSSTVAPPSPTMAPATPPPAPSPSAASATAIVAAGPSATPTPGTLHIIIASPTKPGAATSTATATLTRVPPTATHVVSPTQASPVPAQPAVAISSGTRLAFARARGESSDIWVINTDGSAPARLTSVDGRNREPAWSPDGRSIAFTSDRDGGNDIYVMRADGSAVTRLTNSPANDYNADWSPDGRNLVFVSNRDGNDELYVMRADGSGQVRLTGSAAFDGQPSWSPDGRFIAFTSSRDRDLNVYIVPAAGGAATRLTADKGDDRDPAWSPDSAYLAFSSDRSGQFQIYTMRAEGGDQQRLTNVAKGAESPSWGVRVPGRSGTAGFLLAFVAYSSNAPAAAGAELHVTRGDGNEQRRLTENDVEDTDPAWYIQPAPVASVPTLPPASSPTPAATATVTTPQFAVGAEVVIDDKSPQFTRGGTAKYWKEASIGYGNHMYFTLNTRTADNWGRWTPALPRAGTYEVFAHIPAQNATTQRAAYTIAHAAGQTNKIVNQLQHENDWVSLGTYSFAAQGKDYVSLSDATTETVSSKRIGFDAVKWVYRGP